MSVELRTCLTEEFNIEVSPRMRHRLTPGSLIGSHRRDKRQTVFLVFQLPTSTSVGLHRNGDDPGDVPSPIEENQVAPQ